MVRPPASSSDVAQPPAWLSFELRLLLSLFIAGHLLAAFVSPWYQSTVRAGGGSPLAARLHRYTAPYMHLFNLDVGFTYFAPAPGPSHLIRWVVERPDRSLVEGEFPNKQQQRPRLLYHRHFMLTDSTLTGGGLPEPLWLSTPAGYADFERWKNDDWAKTLIESYARHLAVRHGGVKITLTLVRHRLTESPDVLAGRKLDDPRTYDERPLGSFTREQLKLPALEAPP